jgi:hypothetical protein
MQFNSAPSLSQIVQDLSCQYSDIPDDFPLRLDQSRKEVAGVLNVAGARKRMEPSCLEKNTSNNNQVSNYEELNLTRAGKVVRCLGAHNI